MPNITVTLYDDDGGEEVVAIPCTWDICGQCGGDGTTSAHLGVIDRDEWDADEFDDYVRGAYDRACGCDGGRVKVPNLAKLDADTRARVEAQWADDAQYDAMVEAERRMGC